MLLILFFSISSSKGDHEEDFYYTEIDVFDSNTQDSSGVSSGVSGDSPDQITNCCGDLVEFCNCKVDLSKFKQKKSDEICDESFEADKSKRIRLKKLQNLLPDSLSKKQRKNNNNKGRKNNISKKSSSGTNLVWNKKGLLKCNGTFELKHSRVVGRQRRKLNCSQPLTIQTTNINLNTINGNLKKSIKHEKNNCGLEWSVRRSASSPINIPGKYFEIKFKIAF